MNKKITTLGCATLGLTITGGTVLAALMLDKNDDIYTPENKPLNRGDNYEHYALNINFNREQLKDKLADYEIKDGRQTLVLSEKKFKANIENVVRNVFKTLDRFKSNADKYKIDIHYQFNRQSNIFIDLVWYLETSNYRYYDQFEVSLYS